MKKLNILALMLAVAASCTVSEIDSKFTGKAPDIIASFEDKSTKTVITTDSEGVGTIWWKPGDEINVFYGTTSTHYTSTNREKATAAAFTTTDIICLTESGHDVAQGNVWGLYPYDRNAECDGVSVITTVKAVQSAVPDTFDDDLYPSLAHSTNTMMTFYNVLGGLKFTLSRDDISRITFKGNNDEDLAGKVKLSMNSDNLPEAVVVEGEKTITFTPKDGRTFEKDTSYYLVMLPVVLSNGFTMTFETETEIGTFNYEGNSVEIERSVFGRKENIDTYATFESNGKDFLEPFTITSIGNTSVQIIGQHDMIHIDYRKGTDRWLPYELWSIIELGDGEILQFRAGEGGNKSLSRDEDYFCNLCVVGNGKISVSGNIMSLLDRSEQKSSLSSGSFYGFFSNCDKLLDASNLLLPAIDLKYADEGRGCYESMFSGCRSLTKAPKLPATQLGYCCYRNMFSGCISLKEAPELPATQLGVYCYKEMFSGCTSLVEAPKLPATQLARGCYSGMFSGCTSLTEAPELPATQLATGCYSRMFSGCTSLTEAPELPATHLEYHCYDRMFYGCSNLSYVKCLAEYRNDPDVVEEEYLTMAKYTGYEWLKGVSSTGTFVKSATNGWWVGIPEGWQIISASETEYVDLGLSVKWATCNLGSTSMTGNGYYYQWAAIMPHLAPSYPVGREEDHWIYECPSIENYVNDNKSILDLKDDAAYRSLGGGWKIPTKAEWEELLNNCTWRWTNNYNGTGVCGSIMTSKITGYTNKSIFLPAYNSVYSDDYEDEYIIPIEDYWSSSLITDNNSRDNAYSLRISPEGVQVMPRRRWFPCVVRPVFDSNR